MGIIDRLIRTPHRRCDDAPAPATRVAPDRAQRPPKRWLYAATQESTAGGRSRGGCGATSRFATSQETDRSRTTPAAGAGSRRRRRGPIRRALRHAAEHEATKAHRMLALGVPAKDVRHAREAEERSVEAGAPSERL